MSGIRTGIQLNDQFTSVMYGILNCVSMANSQMADLSSAMNQNIDTSGWEAIQSEISQATMLMDELEASLDNTVQPISRNTEAQERFNRKVQEGVQEANQLNNTISKVGGAILVGTAVKKSVSWIEECTEAFDTQRDAELQLLTVLSNTLDADYVSSFVMETEVTADTSEAVAEINDIQNQVDDVTVMATANTKALTAAFDTITAKASEIQSRGIYGDEVMIAGAAEFSTYFSDTEAIEMMMDTLADYAMGMSGGGEIDSNAMVNYATGLGKVMTGSYEAMTKKGFEFTEAQKAIIEGTATQEQIIAAIGDEYLNASQDVQAAAAINTVIAESWDGLYESMSNTPQGQIAQMTNAWGDMKEVVGGQLYPYVLRFVKVITGNWPTLQTVISNITWGLQIILGILSWMLEGAIDFAQAVSDNWSWISPIIYGIAAALAVYYGWQLAVNAIELLSKGIKIALCVASYAHAAATGAEASATAAATAAQYGLNTAMYACPIVWIIILFIALIVVIFVACNAIAKMTGIANSGFGVMTGGVNVVIQAFKYLGTGIADVLLGIGNAIAALASNMMTAFHNAICSVQSWFYDLLATALYVIEGICVSLNKLPFVEFDYSGISNAADDYAAKAAEAAGNKGQYKSISDAFNEGFSTFDTFHAGWASEAFAAGAAWGDGMADKISNFSLTDLFAVDPLPSMEDYFGDMARDIGDIAGDTGNISDSLDITSEDLKYLRDIAEQDTINRFTTAEIKVDMSGMQNTVNSGDDIDGFMTKLTDSVNEAVDNMTEGVHE